MITGAQLASRLAGKFIVIDGPDGAGKGTQIDLLAREFADTATRCVVTRDPGGTPAGDLIRQILLHSRAELDTVTEVLLFMASRAQLVAQVIRPALSVGSTVLCDRFISATCAYQGATGADPARIVELGRFAVGQTWPDLTIVLDVPAEAGLGRKAAQNGPAADSMESRSLDFHRRVRQIFRSLPDSGVYPRPVVVIDAAGSVDQVHARILDALARFVSDDRGVPQPATL